MIKTPIWIIVGSLPVRDIHVYTTQNFLLQVLANEDGVSSAV